MIDPHNLIATGAELATEGDLARLLGVSRSVLGSLLQGELYRSVRHVRDGTRHLYCVDDYCVDDARTAIAPRMAAIEVRRKAAAEPEARERADGAERRQAKADAHARHIARKAAAHNRPVARSGAPKLQPSPRPGVGRNVVPEVFVRRRVQHELVLNYSAIATGPLTMGMGPVLLRRKTMPLEDVPEGALAADTDKASL
jgi:hypothetical protein